MDFEGKIIAIQEKVREGVGKDGVNFRIDVVVLKEDRDMYPKSIALEIFSSYTPDKNRWDKWQLRIGDKVKAYIDTEAREYNGNWFNSMRVFKIEKWQSFASQPQAQPQQYTQQAPPVQYAQQAPPVQYAQQAPPQYAQQQQQQYAQQQQQPSQRTQEIAGMFAEEFKKY